MSIIHDILTASLVGEKLEIRIDENVYDQDMRVIGSFFNILEEKFKDLFNIPGKIEITFTTEFGTKYVMLKSGDSLTIREV